jgi:hypothetical protein
MAWKLGAMTAIKPPPQAIAAAALGLGALLWLWYKKQPGQSLAGAAGAAAVEVVTDAGAGAVVGLGEVFGIPATETDQCSADIAAGDLWAASFSCPAKRFLAEGVFGTTEDPKTGSW